jgi:hypothetical protein
MRVYAYPRPKKNPPRLLAQTMAGTGEGKTSLAERVQTAFCRSQSPGISQLACHFCKCLIPLRLSLHPQKIDVPSVRKCVGIVQLPLRLRKPVASDKKNGVLSGTPFTKAHFEAGNQPPVYSVRPA